MGNSASIIAVGPIFMYILFNVIFFVIVGVIVKRAVKSDKILTELKLVKMQLRELQETIAKDKTNAQHTEEQAAVLNKE